MRYFINVIIKTATTTMAVIIEMSKDFIIK